jgi:opacity protein-like surface antigen
MKVKIISILICLFSSSVALAANSTGFYIGAGLGQSQTNLSTSLSKDTDTAYNLMGGVQINPNLAAEVEYINLGQVSAGPVSAKSDGFAGTVIGILPLRRNVSLLAKFGLGRINTSWDAGSGVNPSSQTETGLTWGVGGQLDFSPKNGARLTYDSYQIGTTDPVTGSSHTLKLSVLFRF